MIPDEQMARIKKAMNQAIKVMGDRFGSTETDVVRAIEELKASMQTEGAKTVTLSRLLCHSHHGFIGPAPIEGRTR
jgi:hypothetical protein